MQTLPSPERNPVRLDPTGIVTFITLVVGVFLATRSYTSPRTGHADQNSVQPSGLQKVDLSILDDPLDAIPVVLDQTNRLTTQEELSCAVRNASFQLILCAIPGGASTEDHESRLRARHAVIAGLAEAQFAPVNHSRIGVARLRDLVSPDATTNGCCGSSSNPGSRQGDFAFELFRKDKRYLSPSDGGDQRVVLWINDDELKQAHPNAFLSSVILALGCPGTHTPTNSVRLIGPYSSDALKAMLGDSTNCAGIGTDIVALPSASAGALGIPSEPFQLLARTLNQASNQPLGKVVDITTPDPARLARLFAEFKERGVDVDDPSRDHLVVVADSTTLVGRSLPEEILQLLSTRHAAPRHGDPVAGKAGDVSRGQSPPNLHVFSYLAPIDGGSTNSLHRRSTATPRPALFGRDDPNPLGSTGPHQMDALSALALQIQRTDQRIRTESAGSITAVIIGGGDINDTLLVLQALRPVLPNALFATIELDSRLWDPLHWPYSHNMLVASDYGTHLAASAQGRTRPFRDSRQAALFAATLLACDHPFVKGVIHADDPHGSSYRNPSRLFEIGRSGPVPLDPAPPRRPGVEPPPSLHPDAASTDDKPEFVALLKPSILLMLLVVVIVFTLIPSLRSLIFNEFEYRAQPLWMRHDDIGGVRGIWLLKNLIKSRGWKPEGTQAPVATKDSPEGLSVIVEGKLREILERRRAGGTPEDTQCNRCSQHAQENTQAGTEEGAGKGKTEGSTQKASQLSRDQARLPDHVQLSRADILDLAKFKTLSEFKRLRHPRCKDPGNATQRVQEAPVAESPGKADVGASPGGSGPSRDDFDWRTDATDWICRIYHALLHIASQPCSATGQGGRPSTCEFREWLTEVIEKPWDQVRSSTLMDNWDQHVSDENRWILARLIFQEIFEGLVRPWNHYATLEKEADEIIARINSTILRDLADPEKGSRTVRDRETLEALARNREALDAYLDALGGQGESECVKPMARRDTRRGATCQDSAAACCRTSGSMPGSIHEENGSSSILSSARDARAAARELFVIRRWRIRAVKVLLVLATAVTMAFAFWISAALHRENGGFLSGTSVVPSLFALCLVVLIAGMFLFRSHLGLNEMRGRATRFFRISQRTNEAHKGRPGRRWNEEIKAYLREIMFPSVPEHQSPVEANRLWQEYMVKSSLRARVTRVLSLVLLYSVATWVFLYLAGHGHLDLPPIRGLAWRVIHIVLSNLAATAFLFLAFWTIDASMLCSWFLRCLTQGPTVYPKATYKMVQDMRGRVDERIIADYIDIKLVDTITRGIGPLLYLPSILLVLLVCAYNNITYQWAWPNSWIVIIGCHFLVAVVSILILQSNAQEARAKTLEQLDRHLKLAEGERVPNVEALQAMGLSHAREMIAEVRSLEGGVFVGFWRNPAIGATLLPVLAGLLLTCLRLWVEGRGL